MLSEAGGGGDAVQRLITKIEDAAGAAGAASSQVSVLQVDSPNARDMAVTLNAALAKGRRVHLRHYVHKRDEVTERDVDPIRLVFVDGRTYLQGWCRRAEGFRTFRLDRVISVDVLEVPAEVPEEAEQVDADAGLFQASPTDELVELELGPAARKVAEDYPCESVTELDDGRLRIGLRTPDTAWVRRLALRHGEDIRVLAPPGLAEETRTEAAAALALYE
jgi:proteasome accessory factor C